MTSLIQIVVATSSRFPKFMTIILVMMRPDRSGSLGNREFAPAAWNSRD